MKFYADHHRSEVHFNVGDFVFVKLQPYRQHSVRLQRNQKLGMRYFGPFKVLSKIGTVAYLLDLPSHAKIHPIFHVSVLKACRGDLTAQHIPLPLTESADLADKVPFDGEGIVMSEGTAPTVIKTTAVGDPQQLLRHNVHGKNVPLWFRE